MDVVHIQVLRSAYYTWKLVFIFDKFHHNVGHTCASIYFYVVFLGVLTKTSQIKPLLMISEVRLACSLWVRGDGRFKSFWEVVAVILAATVGDEACWTASSLISRFFPFAFHDLCHVISVWKYFYDGIIDYLVIFRSSSLVLLMLLNKKCLLCDTCSIYFL